MVDGGSSDAGRVNNDSMEGEDVGTVSRVNEDSLEGEYMGGGDEDMGGGEDIGGGGEELAMAACWAGSLSPMAMSSAAKLASIEN